MFKEPAGHTPILLSYLTFPTPTMSNGEQCRTMRVEREYNAEQHISKDMGQGRNSNRLGPAKNFPMARNFLDSWRKVLILKVW